MLTCFRNRKLKKRWIVHYFLSFLTNESVAYYFSRRETKREMFLYHL